MTSNYLENKDWLTTIPMEDFTKRISNTNVTPNFNYSLPIFIDALEEKIKNGEKVTAVVTGKHPYLKTCAYLINDKAYFNPIITPMSGIGYA